jgi:hypothetical protein
VETFEFVVNRISANNPRFHKRRTTVNEPLVPRRDSNTKLGLASGCSIENVAINLSNRPVNCMAAAGRG